MTLRGVVCGWYHQRNAGDDRIAHCMERWLGDHHLTFLSHTEVPPRDLLLRSDYVILGGGSVANEVHGAFKGMHQWIQAAGLPVFGVGITVSHHAAFRQEFRAILESGGTLWLRDQPSADWLGFDRGTMVAPDITWLYPLPVAKERSANAGIAVNLRPWPQRSWDGAAWRTALLQLGQPLTPWPLCFGKDADRPMLERVLPGADFPTEFDATVPARSECILAMRYHAILFAIQTGTPFVAIDNSKKLRWLLEALQLTEASLPVEDPTRLEATMHLARSTFTAERLLTLTQSLSAAAWRTANAMKEQIETQALKARQNKAGIRSRLRRSLRRVLASW